MSVGGVTSGTTYGVLNVGGRAVLSGALTIDLVNNYAPLSGTVYTVIRRNSGSGSFSALNYDVGLGISWLPTYTDTSVSLQVTGIISAPITRSTRTIGKVSITADEFNNLPNGLVQATGNIWLGTHYRLSGWNDKILYPSSGSNPPLTVTGNLLLVTGNLPILNGTSVRRTVTGVFLSIAAASRALTTASRATWGDAVPGK